MTVNVCASPNCGKEAKLQCPTCIKLDKSSDSYSHFCSQSCFKSYWNIHKLYHVDGVETNGLPAHFIGYKFRGNLRPAPITQRLPVPSHIQLPDYALDSIPHSEVALDRRNAPNIIHTPAEIKIMRELGKISREVLNIARDVCKVGVTTDEIDRVVHDAIIERGCYPSPLNYYGFQKSICTSINEIICHGIPDKRPLEDGDILNVDVSVFWKGYHMDLNETYLIGNVDERGRELVKVASECLEKAIKILKPGVLFREIGDVIQKHSTAHGFSVVRNYCGHGIGKYFHCNPNILHYAKNKSVGVMKAGHIFTIEPMINEGTWKDEVWPDAWTVSTLDGKRSAQFEHTILITETGCEVLTR
eukprot:gene6259-7796_t